MTSREFDAKSFEQLFDQFVRTEMAGYRLDEMLAEKLPQHTKCADYFFPNDGVIVELKTLNENHGGKDYVLAQVELAVNKLKYPPSVISDWLSQRKLLPEAVAQNVNTKVQNSLKNAVRKANDQIKSTRQVLRKNHDSILIVANLGETLFGPIELLRYLAGHALGRTALSIDAILLVTPGITYASGEHPPQHYIAPVYSEGKQYLGNFLEPLIDKWISFESAALGLKPSVEKVFDIDEASKSARPTSYSGK